MALSLMNDSLVIQILNFTINSTSTSTRSLKASPPSTKLTKSVTIIRLSSNHYTISRFLTHAEGLTAGNWRADRMTISLIRAHNQVNKFTRAWQEAVNHHHKCKRNEDAPNHMNEDLSVMRWAGAVEIFNHDFANTCLQLTFLTID